MVKLGLVIFGCVSPLHCRYHPGPDLIDLLLAEEIVQGVHFPLAVPHKVDVVRAKGLLLLFFSSLSRIRERYGLEVFRRFLEAIVEQCLTAGLVWGRELYGDATKVERSPAFLYLVDIDVNLAPIRGDCSEYTSVGPRGPEKRMSKRELVEAYVAGAINRRTFVRGLTALGLSASLAAAYAVALQPATARKRKSNDFY
jgi:hypothetical protein